MYWRDLNNEGCKIYSTWKYVFQMLAFLGLKDGPRQLFCIGFNFSTHNCQIRLTSPISMWFHLDVQNTVQEKNI